MLTRDNEEEKDTNTNEGGARCPDVGLLWACENREQTRKWSLRLRHTSLRHMPLRSADDERANERRGFGKAASLE